jgi:uncharacterized membrane protein
MKFFSTIISYIGRLFLKGLFALLPLALTITLINFSLNLAQRWLEPVLKFLPQWLIVIPGIEIITVFCFVLLIGFILNYFFIAQIVRYVESLIDKIPFVKQIYMSIKQLVTALGAQEEGTFKEVVLVVFPNKGSYALGFLTGEFPQELRPHPETRYFNIFIPASPNPTSGFFLVVAEEDIVIVNMTRHEAMKLIISGGIMIPDRFKKS